jgi:hypothetical protein
MVTDEDMMGDEGDEGNGEGVVGAVAGKVVKVKDGDDDEVEGSATDAEVVTIAKKVRADLEVVCRVVIEQMTALL